MLIELGKRIDEHSENFNKELVNIIKNYPELKNTKAEIKTTLDKSRLDTEEHLSDLEDLIMEITQSEQKKKNKF